MNRKIYAGPWLATGGIISADNAPVLDASGCTYRIPSRAEVEHSILLAGSSVRHLDGRMEASLLGRNVHIARSDGQPRAYRFMVGDNSEIGIL